MPFIHSIPNPHSPPQAISATSNSRRPFGQLIAIGLILLTTTTSIFSQQTSDQVRHQLTEQIHEQLAELQTLRRQTAIAQHGNTEDQTALQRQVDRLQSDQLKATQQLTALQAEQADLAKEQTALTQTIDQTSQQIDRLAQIFRPIAHLIRQQITNGLNYQQAQRLATLPAIPTNNITDQVDAITQLLDSYHKELNDAAKTEVTTNQSVLFDNGQRKLYVNQWRLGLITQRFLTEDRQTAGQWSGQTSQPWQPLASPHLEQTQTLFDIIDQKQAPQLLSVPLRYTPSHAGRSQP